MTSSLVCEVVKNISANEEFFILQFIWKDTAPKAGQFFMLKPLRASTFLPRPFGVFDYNHEQKIIKFLICKRGAGTIELSQLSAGEKVQLTGPAGNIWADFLPENGKAALIGGSAGIAPMSALVAEKPDYYFHVYAGFRQGFHGKEEENLILGSAAKAKKVIISAEDGRNAISGKITDYIFEPEKYNVIFACGPTPMLKAVKKICKARDVKCYVSTESRFACGIGACLGCTINTVNGIRRCCKDGPIFPSEEVIFDA